MMTTFDEPGDYPRPSNKIALLSDRLRDRKVALVAAEGVSQQGEVPPHLVGWRGGRLIVMFRMGEQLQMMPHRKRPQAVAYAARILRRTWQIDSLTYIEEAFVTNSPDEVDLQQPLAVQFPTNKAISEAITILHAETPTQVEAHALPFHVGLNIEREVDGRPQARRVVTWSIPTPYIPEQGGYLEGVDRVLRETLHEPVAHTQGASLIPAMIESLQQVGWLTVEA